MIKGFTVSLALYMLTSTELGLPATESVKRKVEVECIASELCPTAAATGYRAAAMAAVAGFTEPVATYSYCTRGHSLVCNPNAVRDVDRHHWLWPAAKDTRRSVDSLLAVAPYKSRSRQD